MGKRKSFIEKALSSIIKEYGILKGEEMDAKSYISSDHVVIYKPKSYRMKKIFPLTNLNRDPDNSYQGLKDNLFDNRTYVVSQYSADLLKEVLELFDDKQMIKIHCGKDTPILLEGDEIEIMVAPRIEDDWEEDEPEEFDADEEYKKEFGESDNNGRNNNKN